MLLEHPLRPAQVGVTSINNGPKLKFYQPKVEKCRNRPLRPLATRYLVGFGPFSITSCARVITRPRLVIPLAQLVMEPGWQYFAWRTVVRLRPVLKRHRKRSKLAAN